MGEREGGTSKIARLQNPSILTEGAGHGQGVKEDGLKDSPHELRSSLPSPLPTLFLARHSSPLYSASTSKM